MNIANLALSAEEFSAVENADRATPRLTPQMFVVPARAIARPERRQLQLGRYRIQIRDLGLRQFRVF